MLRSELFQFSIGALALFHLSLAILFALYFVCCFACRTLCCVLAVLIVARLLIQPTYLVTFGRSGASFCVAFGDSSCSHALLCSCVISFVVASAVLSVLAPSLYLYVYPFLLSIFFNTVFHTTCLCIRSVYLPVN